MNLIYPNVCGVCGKIDKNSLCPKCNLELKKLEIAEIIENTKKTKNKSNKNKSDVNISENIRDIDNELNINDLDEIYFDELTYIFKYDGLIRKLILDYKFNEKSYLYRTLVSFILKNKKVFKNIKKYDTIMPVPISKKRFYSRGYNQSLIIAKEIANQTGIKLNDSCLIKVKNTAKQSTLGKEERAQNVLGAYKINNKKNLENKKILLIDDIYTTGNTVNECSKILKKANPEKVGILVLAKD